jgi:hypothetical protein
MAEPSLAELTTQTEDARRHLLDLKARLDAILRPLAGATAQPAWDVLAFADEFGPHHAFETLRAAPELLGLQAPVLASQLAPLSTLLTHADAAQRMLDTMVRLREQAHAARDPDRPPVLVMNGRDVSYNPKTRELMYLDQPQVRYALSMERVPNRASPDPGPEPAAPRHRRRMSP